MGIQELFTELKKIAVTPRYEQTKSRSISRNFAKFMGNPGFSVVSSGYQLGFDSVRFFVVKRNLDKEKVKGTFSPENQKAGPFFMGKRSLFDNKSLVSHRHKREKNPFSQLYTFSYDAFLHPNSKLR